MPRTRKEASSNGGNHKYWCAVLYPENMVDDWEVVLGDLLQRPYAYCIHDKDKTKIGEHRKNHVHMIIAFNNTTTENHAMNVFNKLSASGKRALNKIEAVNDIRHAYDYLIHDTEASKKLGKYLYDAKERHTGNNFDIGDYEQISTADKNRMLRELCDFVISNNITNFADVYLQITTNFDSSYFELIKSYSGLLERLAKGLFMKAQTTPKHK